MEKWYYHQNLCIGLKCYGNNIYIYFDFTMNRSNELNEMHKFIRIIFSSIFYLEPDIWDSGMAGKIILK